MISIKTGVSESLFGVLVRMSEREHVQRKLIRQGFKYILGKGNMDHGIRYHVDFANLKPYF